MGNPHRVIFVPAPHMVDLPRLGGRLSAMAAMVWSVLRGFLQKTEHDFVQKKRFGREDVDFFDENVTIKVQRGSANLSRRRKRHGGTFTHNSFLLIREQEEYMDMKMKRLLSLSLVFGLALIFSTIVFAESGKSAARDRVCPVCRSDTLVDTVEYNVPETEVRQHLDHWDFWHWNIDRATTVCTLCNYSYVQILRKTLLGTECMGFPK